MFSELPSFTKSDEFLTPLRAIFGPVSNIELHADVPNVMPMEEIYCYRSS